MRRNRIAIDFDGTIFQKAKFPEIGPLIPEARRVILALQLADNDLYLWTCRDGTALQMAKDKLFVEGMLFTIANFHPDQEHLSNKLDAEIYIDDKALGCPLTVGGYVDWIEVEKILKQKGYL
jgi:hypothetical protein